MRPVRPRALSAAALLALAACTGGTGGRDVGPSGFPARPWDCVGTPGEVCVGALERPDLPGYLGFRPEMLAVPECGFAIGRHPGFDQMRTERVNDQGRRIVMYESGMPTGEGAADRFYAHPLSPYTIEPVGVRVTVRCVELETDWSEDRMLRRVAADARIERVWTGTGPVGQTAAFLTAIRNRGDSFHYAAWRAAPDRWAILWAQVNLPAETATTAYADRWICTANDVRILGAAACAGMAARASGAPGKAPVVRRTLAQNDAWAAALFATVRPLAAEDAASATAVTTAPTTAPTTVPAD